jgi:hypothetical protein
VIGRPLVEAPTVSSSATTGPTSGSRFNTVAGATVTVFVDVSVKATLLAFLIVLVSLIV